MMRNWPEGKNIAVTFSLMFEGWEDGAAPGIGPMGNPLKPGYLDTANRGWAEYASNNGLDRLLKIFKDQGITGSVFCSGVMMERYPELIKRIDAEGHEIVLHSYAQNICPVYLDEETEKTQLDRCIQLVETLTGKRPAGFGSPRGTGSLKTSELLAERGVKYTIDWMGSDMPMIEKTPKGDICKLPFTMDVNDMPMYVRYGNSSTIYCDTLIDEFENWFNKHPEEKVVYWITAHCHVFGRPYGAIQFLKAMQYIQSLPNVWIAKPYEIASTVIDIDY